MSGITKRRILTVTACICASGLIAASLTAWALSRYYSRGQFQMLGRVCQSIIEEQPEAEKAVLLALKREKDIPADSEGERFLASFGYRPEEFRSVGGQLVFLYSLAGALSGSLLIAGVLWYQQKMGKRRMESLTGYLERVNGGESGLILPEADDAFSRLQDEIYKTVTFALQTRDAALEARQNFADNLSNIAHQLKTPITAISLSTQMMQDPMAGEYKEQIMRQVDRLTHLEEALLLLARLDAGTLTLTRKDVDVLTVLTLAADNLQEILDQRGITVDIPDMGEIQILADLDWTMEALMNLMKNCGEQMTAGGCIHTSYDQNPLYTRIRIWDEGPGFDQDEILHLFERFYRGKHAGEGGIGIGLALAKEILERERAAIHASNLTDGGACFEIRFYVS